jgi:oxygen-independent coproporphyrinogen-3 oxidase
MITADNSARALGLYIHIPFCERKCPYCDFNTYAGLHSLYQNTVDALRQEMGQWRQFLQERTLCTLFIGGGTPTVLESHQLTQLFTTVRRSFQLAENCEITCEANPGAVDRQKFQTLKALGVNRLSMGVQSFQPDELQFLGRIHCVEDVYRAFQAARDAGFDNINLDFIFGLSGQTVAGWEETLSMALALAPEHLSLYSLIVEPGTPLHHWVATGKVQAPEEDRAAELYEIAQERLERAGYVHYEVSNWAKAALPEPNSNLSSKDRVGAITPRFACRHNLLYWRNQEYLGIGPGAHSHLHKMSADGRRIRQRWGNCRSVPGYIKRIQQGEAAAEFSEELDERTAMGETMMLGLRLVQEGVPFAHFHALHGADLRDVFAAELAQLQAWNLIYLDAQRARLSRQGLMVGNQVFSRFLPEENGG